MKDHLLNWHEKFQPLGPALKTPRIEVDAKSAIAEFEERSFDHPSCTGGNAPSLSPQALVTTPAAQRFKKGDRVRVVNRRDEFDGAEGVLTGETDQPYLTCFYVGDFPRHGKCLFMATHLEHISQPSDTKQWVELDPLPGKACPAPSDGVVAYRVVQ